MTDFYLAFLAGFFGGAHCAGMCGPIIAAYSLNYSETGGKKFLMHLMYNSGRIYTYTFLGAAAGLAGSFAGVKSSLHMFARFIKIFSSLLIIWMGLATAGFIPSFFKENMPESFKKIFPLLIASPSKIVLLGLFMGFLPCGLVYAMLIKSANSGDIFKGAGIMLSFGLGTAPSLLFIGFFSSTIKEKLRAVFIKAAGLIVVILGIMMLIKGLKH